MSVNAHQRSMTLSGEHECRSLNVSVTYAWPLRTYSARGPVRADLVSDP